ncbi:MAG: 30S ribosomal protein S17 [Candidatus Bathyarchaeota archaeon]
MRNIGVPVVPPQKECTDPKCPFHSTLSVRGRILEGTVVKDHAQNTVIIRRDFNHYVPKYLRYERRHSHTAAHNPPCIEAKIGEKVKIMECRPLSKSVAFVVIEKK